MGKQLDLLLQAPLSPTGKVHLRVVDVLGFAGITLLGVFARFALMNYVSGDYTSFLEEWFNELQAAGGIRGIGLSIGDYTPPYLYLMALLTYLPLNSLYSIKLLSCVFDLLLAGSMLRCFAARQYSPAALLGIYAAVLFMPTILLNSAYWAQCDVIFTFFVVQSLFCGLEKRPLASSVYFGIAFSLKLQSIFFLPVLALLFLKDRLKIRHLLMIPGVYLLSILPAWIAGRPLSELLTIYFRQSGQYSRLCMNAPNLWYLIGDDRTSGLSLLAIFLTLAGVLFSLYLLYCFPFPLTRGNLLLAALYFSLLLPYLMPHMHERYFFLADVLALLYACWRPRRFYLPLLVGFSSLAGYFPFLFGQSPIDLRLAVLGITVALGICIRDLYKPLFRPKERRNRLM